MRVLIAPDKFKGTLTAKQAAAAMAEGVRRVWPDAEIVQCPMSDGGEGFVDVLCDALGGRRITRTVCGPLPGMRVDAELGLLPDGTAVIEMATAAGLALLTDEQRNPMNTTTYGVGELIRFAVGMDCRHIILGIGGSATIDAGIGCLQALGCPITLTDGATVGPDDEPLCGKDLDRVAGIGHAGLADGLVVDIACDVRNPLTGPDGAAHVYGPQKGATPVQVEQLNASLSAFAERLRLDPATPGGGAAGGIGLGLASVLDVELTKGVELIGYGVLLPHFDGPRFNLVLTGEGRYDDTSLEGKVVGYVEWAAHAFGQTQTLVFCGSKNPNTPHGAFPVVSLVERVGEAEALAEPARHLADAVAARLANV